MATPRVAKAAAHCPRGKVRAGGTPSCRTVAGRSQRACVSHATRGRNLMQSSTAKRMRLTRGAASFPIGCTCGGDPSRGDGGPGGATVTALGRAGGCLGRCSVDQHRGQQYVSSGPGFSTWRSDMWCGQTSHSVSYLGSTIANSTGIGGCSSRCQMTKWKRRALTAEC
jgi:hypothetical protein